MKPGPDEFPKPYCIMVEIKACKWIWREAKVSFTASFVRKTLNAIYYGLVSFGEVFNFVSAGVWAQVKAGKTI